MRVLHLVDLRAAPWSVLAGVLEARRSGGSGRVVVLLGGVTSARRALYAGVSPDVRLAPPVGVLWACRPALEREVGRLGEFDIVHAWSADACALGDAVAPSLPLVASVFEAPASLPARGARRAGGAMRRAAALQFGDALTGAAWLDATGPAREGVVVSPPDCPSVGVDPGELRRALKISPETGVIVAASEPGETVDAMLCMYMVGVLSERGMSATVIVPSDATGLDRAERFSVHHHGTWTVRVCDRPMWELLSIADGVVVADRAPCDGVRRSETILTGAHWGAARGMPVIAPKSDRYERTLRGDVRWVEPGDRLGFVRAAHGILGERRVGGSAAPASGGGAVVEMYRMCGLVNV